MLSCLFYRLQTVTEAAFTSERNATVSCIEKTEPLSVDVCVCVCVFLCSYAWPQF